MTDAAPRPRRRIFRRVMQGLLVVGAVAAAWVYEENAFSIAARTDGNRRELTVYRWPQDAYEGTLRRARDPRVAEELVPDEDSVAYTLVGAAPRQVLRQVFYVTLRHGPRRWRRQMTVTWDQQPAPDIVHGGVVPLSGDRLERDAALAWYDGWLARERAWRRDNARRLQDLVTTLALAGGTYTRTSSGWSLEADSLQLYHQQLASIHRFGEEGVQALVNCLGDAKPTTTRVVVDSADQGPASAGTVCYNVLKHMVDFYGSAPQEDIIRFVNSAGNADWVWAGDLEAPATAERLAAGETAWKNRLAAGEFRYLRPYNVTHD